MLSWIAACVFVALVATVARAQDAPEPAPKPIDFAREIRPLLSDRCFICHGPDAEARESDLRLDKREGALADLGGHAAIVPGVASASRLLERVRHANSRKRMPPPDSKLVLSEREIDLLERWIAQGADYSEHWAFVAPTRGDVPSVQRSGWPQDELDRFVLARLETDGLAPAPPAARETWLRRVTFDLTGLPPSLEELDAFLADDSDAAFECVVERLLASPRYGERMASDWLDAARYSDTYGYQNDVERRVWPWRDWVVRAFNDDLPWDEFATWQLAGDLLPEPTLDQRLATAFNRLHRQTNEGGSVEEEYRVEYVADRVHTFGTSFLGLTMECARCHDHKYDPISQEEYYGLFAFFDDIDESGLYSHFTNAVPTPTLWLPSAEQARELGELVRKRDAAKQALDASFAELNEQFESWRAIESPAVHLRSNAMERPEASFDFEHIEGDQLANQGASERPGKLNGNPQVIEARGGHALHLTGEDSASFPGLGEFTRDDPFTIALWMQVPFAKDRAVVFHRSQAWTDSGSRGYQLLIEDGKLSASLIHFWPGNALSVRTIATLPLQEWVHVAMSYDGSSRAAGLALYLNGERAAVEVVRDKLTRTILGGDQTLTIGQRFRDRGLSGGRVDDFQVFRRRLSRLEIAKLCVGESFEANDDDEFEHFALSMAAAPRKLREELQSARRVYSELADRIPEIMTMEALAPPRVAHLLERGSYLSPGRAVAPMTPASVLPFPASARPDRLGLAEWLVSADNPLFARVAVNRLWQMLFGAGLVATPENFGSQGEAPLQQDLLDYLALELRESGWSVQAMLRRIVLSATYRQDSRADGRALEHDPHNRYLARGPRRSLSAEMIRDNALFVSGLLVEKLGGPPVKPYQPPGLWEEKSGVPYHTDEGEGLWRRSLYTYWKSTSPPPSMLIFDAAKRDVCVVQRQSTNSPLQALVLWNDPQQVEAARMLAQHVMLEAEGDEARLQRLFRLCTSAFPSADELSILSELLASARESYAANSKSSDAWLAIGIAQPNPSLGRADLAAFTVIANTVLGFDGALTLR